MYCLYHVLSRISPFFTQQQDVFVIDSDLGHGQAAICNYDAQSAEHLLVFLNSDIYI